MSLLGMMCFLHDSHGFLGPFNDRGISLAESRLYVYRFNIHFSRFGKTAPENAVGLH